MSDTEVNAVNEVTASRGQRLAEHFVYESVRDPLMMRKLRIRGAFALHAVVGLDAAMRTKVEQQIIEALKRRGLSDESRTDLAVAAAELGDLSPPAAAEV